MTRSTVKKFWPFFGTLLRNTQAEVCSHRPSTPTLTKHAKNEKKKAYLISWWQTSGLDFYCLRDAFYLFSFAKKLRLKVPSDSEAAVEPAWHASTLVLALSIYYPPAGQWARFDAADSSTHSASSALCWGGGTPVLSWTHAVAAALHALSPCEPFFYLIPNP